jgi:hypothetical protein
MHFILFTWYENMCMYCTTQALITIYNATKTKLSDFGPQANYTDQATANFCG